MRLSRWRRAARALSLMLLTGAALSCDRSPTANGDLGDRSAARPLLPTAPSQSYTAVGTYSVGGVNPSGSTTDRTSPGPTLPNKQLLYRVTAAGNVSVTRTSYWNNGPTTPAVGSYGPSGYANSSPTGQTCYAFMSVGSTSTYGGETWYAPSCLGGSGTPSSHVYLAGSTTINRASSTGGGQWDCYAPSLGYGPCFSWTDDGQTVTIDRVEAGLDVVAAPSTVSYADTVTVTASISPGGPFDGREIPWTIDSTRWAPVFGSQASPCAWNNFVPTNTGPSRTCRKPFTRSGTLTVFATVNGTAQSKAVSITITPPTLKVVASANMLPAPAPVTFTATVTPSQPNWKPSSWTWRPEQGTGGISSDCNWFDNPCTRTISKTGWMKAVGVVGEYTLTDSVRVSLDCTTGDSVLDNPAFRNELTQAWLTSQMNPRTEGGFAAFDSSGTLVFRTTPFNAATDTGCRMGNDPVTPYPGSKRYQVHIHPWRLGDITNCPSSPGTVIVYGYGECGFSEGDWEVANRLDFPGVMMDADSIYVMDRAPTLSDFVSDSTSRTIYRIVDCASKRRSYPRACATGTIALSPILLPERRNLLLAERSSRGVVWA